jgi:hypothetical protein
MGEGIVSYQIKGWTKFQHYQSGKRNPDWIKLYRGLLDDIDWHLLDARAAKALVGLWLLASENGGDLPGLNKIAFRLRLTEKEAKSILSQLSHWLEQDDSEVLADCYQSDSLEENKKENKKENGADAPLVIMGKVLDEEHAKAVLAYRTKGKQSNSPLALTRLANQLSRYPKPNEGAAEMICRGWKGFDPEWMHGQGRSPPQNGNGGLKAPLQFKPEAKEIIKPPPEDRERQLQRLMKARAM